MKSYYDEMQDIYSRLEEIESIINPSRNPFFTNNIHPLSRERDELCKKYWELWRYDNSFMQRKNPIIVSMYITGGFNELNPTPMQIRINYSVAYNQTIGQRRYFNGKKS